MWITGLRRFCLIHWQKKKILSDKHLSSSHFHSENHMILNDSDANEDSRTYITCPFCYFDIDLSVLGAHLEEEHCFDDKNSVCPVCALNLGKDIVGHFRVHHASSLKNDRKPHKSSFWNPNIRELSSIYGFTRSGGNVDDVSSDPFLAPFLSNTSSYLELKNDSLQDSICSDASVSHKTESSKAPGFNEGREKDYEKRMQQRAEFLQEMIFSTIF